MRGRVCMYIYAMSVGVVCMRMYFVCMYAMPVCMCVVYCLSFFFLKRTDVFKTMKQKQGPVGRGQGLVGRAFGGVRQLLVS